MNVDVFRIDNSKMRHDRQHGERDRQRTEDHKTARKQTSEDRFRDQIAVADGRDRLHTPPQALGYGVKHLVRFHTLEIIYENSSQQNHHRQTDEQKFQIPETRFQNDRDDFQTPRVFGQTEQSQHPEELQRSKNAECAECFHFDDENDEVGKHRKQIDPVHDSLRKILFGWREDGTDYKFGKEPSVDDEFN